MSLTKTILTRLRDLASLDRKNGPNNQPFPSYPPQQTLVKCTHLASTMFRAHRGIAVIRPEIENDQVKAVEDSNQSWRLESLQRVTQAVEVVTRRQILNEKTKFQNWRQGRGDAPDTLTSTARMFSHISLDSDLHSSWHKEFQYRAVKKFILYSYPIHGRGKSSLTASLLVISRRSWT